MAARILGELGDSRGVPGLIDAFRETDDAEAQGARSCFRGRVAEALGKIADAQATPCLIEGMRDSNNGVREASARALGRITDPRVTGALIEALDESELALRSAAMSALGGNPDPRAMECLLGAVSEAPASKESEEMYWAAVVALGGSGSARALEPLMEIAHKNPCETVIRALGCLGNAAATSVVIEYVRGHRYAWEGKVEGVDVSEQEARSAAVGVTVLGEIGGPEAIRALLEMTGNPRLASASVGALEGVLARSAGEVAATDLRACATLRDVQQTWWEWSPGWEGMFEDDWKHSTVGTANLARLATEELARRGASAPGPDSESPGEAS